MAKKGLLVLVLAAIVAGGVFAQENELWGGKKNFISADLGLLVGGLRYERFLTQNISIGVDVYWANSFIIFNELEAGLFGRYYLWKGLFAELGLGFHTHSGIEDMEYEVTSYGGTKTMATASGLVTTAGLGVTPGVGWKFDPGKGGGFFVEPGVLVPITIGEKSFWLSQIDKETGVSVGFVLYCGLGWAF